MCFKEISKKVKQCFKNVSRKFCFVIFFCMARIADTRAEGGLVSIGPKQKKLDYTVTDLNEEDECPYPLPHYN